MFYFILVHDSYPAHCVKERKLWCSLGLLCRAYSLPEEEFKFWRSGPNKRLLKSVAQDVVHLIKHLYGDVCCTYYIHMVLHLEQVRIHGPFPVSSAFSTEGFYQKVRKAVMYHASKNIGKQVMRLNYLQYSLKHRCQRNMFFSEKDTSKKCDKYCYTFDGTCQEYQFYRIKSVSCETLSVVEVIATGLESANSSQRAFKFSNAGVKIHLMEGGNLMEIPIVQVAGKAIRVAQYIIACSKLTLFEAN